MFITSYFVKSSALQADGTLHIKWAGGDEEGTFWDGYYDVAPNDAEYPFWLWLRQRLKRRWFGGEGVAPEEVERYRVEFRNQQASGSH